MTKEELIAELKKCRTEPNQEARIREAYRSLLAYINDAEVTTAFGDAMYGGW